MDLPVLLVQLGDDLAVDEHQPLDEEQGAVGDSGAALDQIHSICPEIMCSEIFQKFRESRTGRQMQDSLTPGKAFLCVDVKEIVNDNDLRQFMLIFL